MGFGQRTISAYLFLSASARRLEKASPRRFGRLAGPLMLLGVAWGAILMVLWLVTFHVTYLAWPHMLNWVVVPSVICGLAMTFGPHRRSALALVETVVRGRRRLRWVGLVLLAAAVAAILNNSLTNPDWSTHLSPRWAWLWPRALCRVLLLAPIWGAWSMVVLGQFHRPGRRTDPHARRLAETVRPLTAAICLAAPLAGSLVFLNFLYPWHFIPPAAAAATALGGGTLIVRLGGGLSRQAFLATNFLTQLGFLTAYLIVTAIVT